MPSPAANRVADAGAMEDYAEAVRARGLRVVATIPMRTELTHRRVSDLVRELGLDVVRGGELHRRMGSTAIIAQTAPQFLSSLVPDRLLIVPGDRHEVLMGAALAEAGGTRLSAVLLTGGIAPDPGVLELCEAAAPSRLPILSTSDRTFETAQRVLELGSQVPGDDEERARRLMETFADSYDPEWVALSERSRPERVTPVAFTQCVRDRASAGMTRIAVSDGTDARVLRAVCGLDPVHTRCVVVSPPEKVEEAVRTAGLQLPTGTQVVDPGGDEPFTHALGLQEAGDVDGVVGGIDPPRSEAVRLVQSVVPARSDVVSVSASRFVHLPDEVLLHADTAVVVEPDAHQLACIAAQTAATAELFGLTPRIAFVRPSSSSPHADEQRERITTAMRVLAERRPDLRAHGPVGYRTATTRSPRPTDGAENATVLVFPEIASATGTIRVAAGSLGVRVHPPLLQGLSRPVNLLPREALVDDVTVALLATVLQEGYSS